MSASEYLPLCQSFTNRTHIRNGRRFDQSEISQIIEKNICCGVILSRNICGYVNLPITYILVTVCPADGVTNRYSIWIDPIEKFTSNGMWRIIADSLHDYTRRGYCSAAKFSATKFTYGYFRNYFRGRIFTPSKREWVRATPLQHGSTWCGFKGSVVKMRVDEPLSKWLQLEKLSS